ncbi:MAG: aromatic ring-hydroxylating dioxygenase subunit alpha [Pseudomonadota bacterium]
MEGSLQVGERPGEGFLTDLWYLAAPGKALKPGRMVGRVFMDQPILLGRDKAGQPFALRDLCPHRGVALSAGRFDGAEVSCPFHGWRFATSGQCQAIPSLVETSRISPEKVKVRSYPCREVQGNVWIFLGAAGVTPTTEPPTIPEIGAVTPKVTTPLDFETDLDNAVYGLLDPAHTPYVHEGLFWRRPHNLRLKTKAYEPSELGFTMTRHRPAGNTAVYKLMGGQPTTEISFRLPGVRLEHIRIGRHHICNMTAMTPISAKRTQVVNLLYWTNPVITLIQPFLAFMAKRFLGQDQWIVGLQNESAVFTPPMMLVNDADSLQRWYLRLKKEWRRTQAEGGPFENPVKATTFQWRS